MKTSSLKTLLLRWKSFVPGLLAGALAGYAYYYFWGCTEGCTISSSPVNSIIYGATMGALVQLSFRRSS
jgi:hypothetical protein